MTEDEARRGQMRSALASTVLDAAARRLAEAIADYDAALERRAALPELRRFDQEVARAEREHASARRQAIAVESDRRGTGI